MPDTVGNSVGAGRDLCVISLAPVLGIRAV